MRPGRKATLTEDAVRELRRALDQRRAGGVRSRWLKQEAKRLSASYHAVRNAALGNSYRWVS